MLGKIEEPVVIDLYEDPQCPVCGRFNKDIEPLLVASIAVAIVGGLGSLWGPLVGGALYGVLSQFASYQWGTIWGETAGLLLVIAVLVWKPEGLLGRRTEVKL